IQAMGTDLLLVRPGGPEQRGRGDITTLVPADGDALAGIPGVASVSPETQGTATLRFGNADHRTSITGTSSAYPDARNWPAARGVFFTDMDVREYAPVIALGRTVAQALFPDGTDPIGQYVLITNVP